MKGVEITSKIKNEVKKVVIGQEKIVDSIIRGILAQGHILIEGVPGLAKTVIIRTFSEIMGCGFKRVQFTVDLLPSDIIGINSFDGTTKEYKVVNGPIFTNLLLADEINRASPKVQSALLEAMAEKQVTIGNATQELPKPFFVFATQNPLESLGTYPLPQAQLDRFLFKLIIEYPSIPEETEILSMRVSENHFAKVKQVLTPEEIIAIQKEISEIYVDKAVKKYIVRLIDMTRFPKKYGLKTAEFIELGCGPRATIGLIAASRAEAFMNGRDYVTPQDVKEIAKDVLAHRIEVNYLGQAKNISPDGVIKEMLLSLPIDI